MSDKANWHTDPFGDHTDAEREAVGRVLLYAVPLILLAVLVAQLCGCEG